MPTLDAPKLWRPVPADDIEGTTSGWPMLATFVVATKADWMVERPTSNESFSFVAAPAVDSDSKRVRRAVRRGVEEFGAAFDRLGGT
jgi:hypothetical protein